MGVNSTPIWAHTKIEENELMNDSPVIWSIDERGVATVTLNRPAVNNAYDDALIGSMLTICGRRVIAA